MATPVSPPPLKAPCVLDVDVNVIVPLVNILPAKNSKALHVIGVLRSAGVSSVVATGPTGSTAMTLIDADPTNLHVLYIGRTVDATVTFEARSPTGAVIGSIKRTAYIDEFDTLPPLSAGSLGFGAIYDVRLADVGFPCVRAGWDIKSAFVHCATVLAEGQPVLGSVSGIVSRTDQSGTQLILTASASHRVNSVEIVGATLLNAVFVDTGPNYFRTVVILTRGMARQVIWRDNSGVEVGRSDVP